MKAFTDLFCNPQKKEERKIIHLFPNAGANDDDDEVIEVPAYVYPEASIFVSQLSHPCGVEEQAVVARAGGNEKTYHCANDKLATAAKTARNSAAKRGRNQKQTLTKNFTPIVTISDDDEDGQPRKSPSARGSPWFRGGGGGGGQGNSNNNKQKNKKARNVDSPPAVKASNDDKYKQPLKSPSARGSPWFLHTPTSASTSSPKSKPTRPSTPPKIVETTKDRGENVSPISADRSSVSSSHIRNAERTMIRSVEEAKSPSARGSPWYRQQGGAGTDASFSPSNIRNAERTMIRSEQRQLPSPNTPTSRGSPWYHRIFPMSPSTPESPIPLYPAVSVVEEEEEDESSSRTKEDRRDDDLEEEDDDSSSKIMDATKKQKRLIRRPKFRRSSHSTISKSTKQQVAERRRSKEQDEEPTSQEIIEEEVDDQQNTNTPQSPNSWRFTLYF